jgi:hypothetical protein
MAEAVLFNVSASIITSSSSLSLQEIGLLCGFKDELKKLGNTVSTIQAVLLDAEEQQAIRYATIVYTYCVRKYHYKFQQIVQEIKKG